MWKNKKTVATKLSKTCLLENSLIDLAEQNAWLEYLEELKKRNIYKEERSLVADSIALKYVLAQRVCDF